MTTDEAAEYELAALLEDIEKKARRLSPMYSNAPQGDGFAATLVRMFDRARMNGVIRYPVPS